MKNTVKLQIATGVLTLCSIAALTVQADPDTYEGRRVKGVENAEWRSRRNAQRSGCCPEQEWWRRANSTRRYRRQWAKRNSCRDPKRKRLHQTVRQQIVI